MNTPTGRGAWPATGRGGTLNAKGTSSGQFYRRAIDPEQTIGAKVALARKEGRPVEWNDLAVWSGVTAIQMLLAGRLNAQIQADGVFGAQTKAAVKAFQRSYHLTEDGVVGRATMQRLLAYLISFEVDRAKVFEHWKVIWGLLNYEGGWDPGAVGSMDPLDLGLAQINLRAHPDVSFASAFCASYAVRFNANLLAYGLNEFGNLGDAVASYNLGHGGTRRWIAAGRPAIWTPQGATGPRNVQLYIDRILGVYDKEHS